MKYKNTYNCLVTVTVRIIVTVIVAVTVTVTVNNCCDLKLFSFVR